MSTKSSLAFKEWKTSHKIHIYNEMLDDKYYIETDDGRVSLPKKLAEAFAKILEGEDLNEDMPT